MNTWRGLQRVAAAPMDWRVRVAPFIAHVQFLVPKEEESKSFQQWLGHIVQKPAILPHTYYLIDRPEQTGIGRNLLVSMLVRALRGHVAANVNLSELLDGKGFTGRLSQKLLATVDEAYDGGGHQRYKRANRLKSLITEEHREVNHKYGFQVVEKNCCRWLIRTVPTTTKLFPSTIRTAARTSLKIRKCASLRPITTSYMRCWTIRPSSHSIRQYLATMDISSYKPGAHAPMNEVKRQVLDRGKNELDHALAELRKAVLRN